MKRLLSIFFTICIIACFSSCNVERTYNQLRTTSFTPDYVRMDMNLSDMQLLGQTTLTVQTRTYLGIFKHTDYVNGIRYDYRKVSLVDLNGSTDVRLNKDLKKAAYKALEEFPEADYFVPVTSKKEVDRMFLGHKTTYTTVIKAYKFVK